MDRTRNAPPSFHAHDHRAHDARAHAHADAHGRAEMRPVGDPFSALAMSASRRLGMACGLAVLLWLAVFWAIAP
jgi:uncharacterized oligopeptide transporter (OPT) family protein